MQVSSKDIFEDPDITDFTLFPIQATAVQWMRTIENKMTNHGEMAGGVLADEMGLGKTIMMTSLCEANLVPTTLVIAPLNTIQQIARQFLKTAQRLHIFKIDDHQFLSHLTWEIN